MSYDSSQPSVRDRIIDSVKAALLAVVPPAFTTDLSAGTVRLWNADVFELVNYPALLITPLQESADDTECNFLQAHELPIGVVIAVKDQDWDPIIRKAIADVEVAMLADYSRGGLATTTKLVSTEVYDSTASAPVAAAQMIFSIHYRTLYGDPNTPH